MRKLLLAALLALLPICANAQTGAQIGVGQVWGNSTAARAPGKSETVTAILDRALSSVRGSIIERGASGWVAIGPGTTGKPWVANGAGADPAYQTLGVVGGGTNCAAASGTCLDNITGFSSVGFVTRSGAGSYAFLSIPLTVANGGTNCAAGSGTCLDNITGFSSTGLLNRTGAGTYVFVPLPLSAANGGSPYITPLQAPYNAKCDGTTDDAVALQSALTAAAGKTLFVPGGFTCVTSAVLTVTGDNTTIRGASSETSGFKSLISNRGAIFYMANRKNITISDLSCTGTRSVVAWTLPSFGCIDVEQDVAAASVLGGFTFRNLRMSGFNSTYWGQISLSNSTFDMTNVVLDNILVTSVAADIPTDGTAVNNVNYGFAIYGGTTGPSVRQISIRNVTIEGTGLCFGVGLYNTQSSFAVTNNKFINVGATSTAAHCTNGLGFTNSYPLFVYDVAGAGFPSTGGLISGNYILNPYSNGVYTVGAANGTLAYNDFNTTFSNNTIIGQNQSDLPIRGAIALNNYTNAIISDNKLYNNWAGIVLSGQYIGQVQVDGNHCATNVSGGSCISLAGAAGTTGNVPEHNIRNNVLQATGASSSVVKVTNDVTHYLGSINFSNNNIVGDVSGANLSGLFMNGRLVIADNVFSGIASTSMLDVSSLTGSVAVLRNNIFDLTLSSAGTGLKTTSSVIYASGATFMNRNSGAAFAFSGVGSTGTLNGFQFSNVATANQVVASSIGLAKPTWSASSQDFVQNLTTAAALSASGWVNTANGVNWVASGGIAGQFPGTATNDNATAGNVREYVSSTVLVGSAVSLTTSTAANVTQISLTAGDWDVWGNVSYSPNGATTITALIAWISTTSATLPTIPNNGAYTSMQLPWPAGTAQTIPAGATRLSLASTTTVYLSTDAIFGVNTMSAYGFIGARRR